MGMIQNLSLMLYISFQTKECNVSKTWCPRFSNAAISVPYPPIFAFET